MKIITFGEIMLRLATRGFQRFSQTDSFTASFGGGEANVAVSLAQFGMDVSFVTRLPKNDIANSCIQELKKYGVDTSDIIFGGERMGLYFLEAGAVNRPSKVIYDRVHSAISAIKPGMIDWESVFKNADWFHWTGITPAISQSAADVCNEAIDFACKKGITVSCDLNYRKNLWKYGKEAKDIMPELVSKCDIILGNEEDADKVLGIKPDGVVIEEGKVNPDAYLSVSKQIMKIYPKARKIITTLRGSVNANHNTWSGTLYNGSDFIIGTQYDITHIVDRVGGGDAFMAGIIYGLLNYKDDTKALEFAIAASCLKHTIHGDFNLVSLKEVENLINGDKSGRVNR